MISTGVKRAVAYVAFRLVSGVDVSYLHDLSDGGSVMFTGTVSDSSVNIFDFDRGCHVSGTGSRGRFTLFDFGSSAHIDLATKPDGRILGFDFATAAHFTGSVAGRLVTLTDLSSGTVAQYSV